MARLDADRTAKPRTELVAHVPTDGRCVRPGDWIDELRDVKATSWFQYRVHTGPTIVRDCCEWMRQAGIEAEAGTEHVYGKLQAVDRADAMERIDAALGFRVGQRVGGGVAAGRVNGSRRTRGVPAWVRRAWSRSVGTLGRKGWVDRWKTCATCASR